MPFVELDIKNKADQTSKIVKPQYVSETKHKNNTKQGKRPRHKN
jgi:hypothetical protein